MHRKLHHHKSLEGLRAVAALAVTFYHLEIPGFSGGFIGVDIFFVISGFLIGHNILLEHQEGQFKLTNFYAKRARRILPIYFATIFLVGGVAFWFADPVYLKIVFNEIMFSAVYLSNFFYYSNVFDYFAQDAKNSVLLHTWSLSIEEQFYIIFPVFILLTARSKYFIHILSFGCLISFALCVVWTYRQQPAAYFLTPFRAWEFLIGALGAYFYRNIKIDRHTATLISAAAIAAVVCCIVLITEQTAFPGFVALLPCVACLCIILFGERAWTAFGLRTSLARFFGRISYALYMVHWPIVVFSKKLFGIDQLSIQTSVLLFSCIVVFAYALYRIVEEPTRRIPLIRKQQLFAYSGFAIVLALASSMIVVKSEGFPARFGAVGEKYFRTELAHSREWECYEASLSSQDSQCRTGARDTEPSIIVFGDSMANQFVELLQSPLERADQSAVVVSVGGCPPLPGITSQEKCELWWTEVVSWLEQNKKVKKVILAARWPSYRDGPNESMGDEWRPLSRFSNDQEENQIRFDSAFENALQQFETMGIDVIVVDTFPVWPRPVIDILLMEHRNISYSNMTNYERVRIRNQTTRQLFEGYEADERISFVTVLDKFCPESCLLTDQNGFPTYVDTAHPSRFGMAMAFGPEQIKALIVEP